MKVIDTSKLGKGGLISKPKLKDYRLESLASAVVLPIKFSVRDKVGKIKHQNGSSSCVSQATAYYAEVLNYIETGNILLSAEDAIKMEKKQIVKELSEEQKKFLNKLKTLAMKKFKE
jgi:hypothetical protein